jgi:hypothetical protein
MRASEKPDLLAEPRQRAKGNVLIIGSAPDAMRAKTLDMSAFRAVVAINNAWQVTERWSHAIHPSDFPLERRPIARIGQSLHSAEDYVPTVNRYGGFVYSGGTMAFTAAYWALCRLSPRSIVFLGCDMVYDAAQTHFYGNGRPDPLRQDPTLRSLEAKSARFEIFARQAGCRVVNLSEQPVSRLVHRRQSVENLQVNNFGATQPIDWVKVARATAREARLGYTVASGKYWKEQQRFEVSEIDALDALWLSALPGHIRA